MTALRALLLTDVVDSTQLASQLGDAAMARVWAAHDRVARDLLRAHGGREIDKTDGFLLLFDEPAAAAAYALAYHRALRALEPPLQARAGLHLGPVILTENLPQDVALGAKPLEVDGLAKPMAARVMSLAGAGQTLLTAAAHEALETAIGTAAARWRSVSHGHWRIKGVPEPLEIFELGDADAPFTPPPDGSKVYRVVRAEQGWLPLKAVRHNLPQERDAFIGRHEDLLALAQLFDSGARLVNVVGTGGTGKTRLLTRFGWTWLGEFPGGLWFCDLADARTLEAVVLAVARALDVPLAAGDPVQQLGHAIAARGRCLLILDNFEQVASHAAATVGRWLDRAGDAVFGVTSREVLGLPGETTLNLAPLQEAEALSLFAARAAQARHGYTLGEEDRPHVQALVRLLDALPLAIELAAARVRVMQPREVLQRMTQRFKLLAAPGSGRQARQATLQATLDWSWDLLGRDEQATLAQLSVFEGGFTLDAAEAVLDLGSMWPTDAVQALVDKSLVRRIGDQRLDLLVSVQEYAAQKLQDSGAVEGAQARHGACYAAFGSDEAVDALYTHGSVARLKALVAELGNLVVAGRRAIARHDERVYAAVLQAVWPVVEVRGPYAVAAELARLAWDAPGDRLGPRARAMAHRVGGQALVALGRGPEAQRHYDAALDLARQLGDRRGEAIALRCQGILALYASRMNEGRALCEQALALHRELGHRRAASVLMGNLGLFEFELGHPERSRALHEEALAGAREVGDRRYEGIARINLANVFLQQGQADAARGHYDAALAMLREVGDRVTEAVVLGNLGGLYFEQGQAGLARESYEAALALHREVGNRRMEGLILAHLGSINLAQGLADEAGAQFHAGLALARETGFRRVEGHVLGCLGALSEQQGQLDLATRYYADGAALLREVGDPVVLGLLLCGRARLELRLQQPAVARATLDEVGTLVHQVAAGADSELGRELARVRALLAEPP